MIGTLGTAFLVLCAVVMTAGFGFLVEDVVKHHFGWGCYRDDPQRLDEPDRLHGEALLREAESLVVREAEALLRDAAGGPPDH